ncbi:MAG: cellulase family glycosylhydrolase [Janthinobacterium lividum]
MTTRSVRSLAGAVVTSIVSSVVGMPAASAATPGQVPDVVLQRLDTTMAVVQWASPVSGGSFDRFDARLYDDAGDLISEPTTDASTHVYFFNNLKPKTHYTFYVRAGDGSSPTDWGPFKTASFTTNKTVDLLGINLSSAEFGVTNITNSNGSGRVNVGIYGRDYTYPTHAEIDYYARVGMNVARVPFMLERMQDTMNGPLDAAQLARMDDLVAYAGTKGITILLDPHNYGFMWAHQVGSASAPDSAFANFWGRMAAHYANTPNVIFGLMNEPYLQTPSAWAVSCNLAIQAIRNAENWTVTHQINAPGTFHENGASYVSQHNSDQFAQAIVDPRNQTVFEIHQYDDPDQSGSDTRPSSATIGAERLVAVTAWARAHGKRLFLGEFGGVQDSLSVLAVKNVLLYMLHNRDVWQGGTQWAGGPWWPLQYAYSLEPVGSIVTPEMKQLALCETVVH